MPNYYDQTANCLFKTKGRTPREDLSDNNLIEVDIEEAGEGYRKLPARHLPARQEGQRPRRMQLAAPLFFSGAQNKVLQGNLDPNHHSNEDLVKVANIIAVP